MTALHWFALFVLALGVVCVWIGHQAEVVRRELENEIEPD